MKRLAPPPQKNTQAYRQLWRVVDGAVSDTFAVHPDYIEGVSARRAAHIRGSIVKRVTGAVLGYAAEVARGRSGVSSAADTGVAPATRDFLARWVRAARKLSGGHHPLSHYSHVLNAWLVVLFAIAWTLLPLQHKGGASSYAKGLQIAVTERLEV